MSLSFFADGIRHLPAHGSARAAHAPRMARTPRALNSRCAAVGREPLRLPRRAAGASAPRAGTSPITLGAASAGPIHAWALPVPAPAALPLPVAAPAAALPQGASVVRVPLELIQAMRRTAVSEGRDEAAVWAEAAREWLASRARDDEPQPPTPAAAALPCPRAASTWAAIDAVLADLGTSRHAGRVA